MLLDLVLQVNLGLIRKIIIKNIENSIGLELLDLISYSNQELLLWRAVEGIIDRLNFIEKNYIEKEVVLDLMNKIRVLEFRIDAAENTNGVLDTYIKKVNDKVKDSEFERESNYAALVLSIEELEEQVKRSKARVWGELNKNNKRIDDIENEIMKLTINFEKVKI